MAFFIVATTMGYMVSPIFENYRYEFRLKIYVLEKNHSSFHSGVGPAYHF